MPLMVFIVFHWFATQNFINAYFLLFHFSNTAFRKVFKVFENLCFLRMDIPQSFRPKENLDDKVKEYLKRKKIIKKKRRIIIDVHQQPLLNENDIYVHIGSLRISDSIYCIIDIASKKSFQTGSYYHTTEKNVEVRLNSEEKLIEYLKKLQRKNKGILLWEPRMNIEPLKSRFEERYKYTLSKWID